MPDAGAGIHNLRVHDHIYDRHREAAGIEAFVTAGRSAD
jgi:hypothetical protein